MVSGVEISDIILSTGAVGFGIAKVDTVSDEEFGYYLRWLDAGCHGSMSYMERNIDVRRDPRLLLPDAKSIIMVAFPYYHDDQFEGNLSRIAAYAHGDDYHEVIRRKLSNVVNNIIDSINSGTSINSGSSIKVNDSGESRGTVSTVSHGNISADRHGTVSAESIGAVSADNFRICVDTAPLLERYWAVRSGLGFIGRNHLLIVPGYGSYVLLGSIITTVEFAPTAPNCGNCLGCNRCIAACPANALSEFQPHKSNRCLSYLTIEYRGDYPEGTDLHERLYGCDICQQVCPHNNHPAPTTIAEFTPREALRELSPERALQLTQPEFSNIMRHSAIKRTKLAGLQRNARCILDRTTINSDSTSSNR